MNTSVILSTYNRPDALQCVLGSLDLQKDFFFEVVVADDGSGNETKKVIEEFQQTSDLAVKYVWQADDGFRAAKIRNKAVAQAEGDYIIFIDGDCVTFPDFLAKHSELAEKGYFVRGSRVMLSEPYTKEFINSGINLSDLSKLDLLGLRLTKKMKRILPLMRLPLGSLRKQKEKKWYGVKTCNLGMWREDFLSVNGFDEQYVGWGHEDADLAIRLINKGVYRKEGVYAVTVMHLWHSLNDRSHLKENEDRLEQRMQSKTTYIENGISQYL